MVGLTVLLPVALHVAGASGTASGRLQNAALHFFRVQGRQFEETFVRVVGGGPQASQATAETQTTMLALDFAPDLAAAFDFVLPAPDLRLPVALLLRTGLAVAFFRGGVNPAASSNSTSASSM